MSIFGALNSAVSGIRAQGAKIGIISDNISNLNTTGYKRSEAAFETLVNNVPGTVQYNPGGVSNTAKQHVDRQGLLEGTDSATDIAITGAGLFVVNSKADGSGQVLYSRAGSFTPDSLGNFKNPSGFFLQAWPLDANGLLPGETGNADTTSSAEISSLSTVNLKSSSGTATATTSVAIGANLDASEPVYPGAGRTINFVSTENGDADVDDVLVPVVGSMEDGDTFTVTTESYTYTFEYGGVAASSQVSAGTPIQSAVTSTQPFYLSGTEPSGADATFTINTASLGTVTFTYRQSAPNPFSQQFNSLSTLATAIDELNGLSARIYDDTLYVVPDDANEAMTFGNGGLVTDWVADLGLVDTVAAAGNPRFGTLQDLANKVNDSDGISSEVEDPLANTTVKIRTDDPLGTITFDDSYGAAAYNLLVESGIIETAADALTYGPVYDPLRATTGAENMAGGEIAADYPVNVRLYDSLGTGHNFQVAYLKLDTNIWGVEIYAADDHDINGTLNDDLIAYGTLRFNGDGSLRAVEGAIGEPVEIEWANGAVPSLVEFDWGTQGQPFGTEGATSFGDTDGISQFDSDYNVVYVDRNGAPVGELVGVTINDEGFVTANFSNGESSKIYKIPLAQFASYNSLQAKSGNVFAGSDEAGEVNLRQAGTNGVGTVVAGSLESSNVELASELTAMIVAQRAYQANTKVVSAADDLLQELNQL
jgi:flagellar hook protein FlgE